MRCLVSSLLQHVVVRRHPWSIFSQSRSSDALYSSFCCCIQCALIGTVIIAYTCVANSQQNSDSLHVHLVIIINPQHACVARVDCVCLCVCVSVESHLTSEVSVRHENAVTYSAGNEGQNIFTETALWQRSSTSCIVWLLYGLPFSLHRERACAYFDNSSFCAYQLLLVQLAAVACCSASGSSIKTDQTLHQQNSRACVSLSVR